MVPHATSGVERRRSSSRHPAPSKFKFPDFSNDHAVEFEEDEEDGISRGPSPRPLPNGLPPGLHSSERWPVRKESSLKSWASWAANGKLGGTRPARQKSLVDAIKTVRTRKASISENAHEIAESLKAPVSLRLVVRLPNSSPYIISTAALMPRQAPLRLLVCVVDSHEYLVKSDPHCPAETYYLDRGAVHARIILVHLPLLARKTQHRRSRGLACVEERYPET